MKAPTNPVVTKLYAAWYLCLALAFIALAWRSYLYETATWGIWLRLIISAGFFFLFWITIRDNNNSNEK